MTPRLPSLCATLGVGSWLALACGTTPVAPINDDAGGSDTGSSGGDGGDAGACCPADPAPGCCMKYGGWSDTPGACLETCDGMPVPGPGWHLGKDAHGCDSWAPPSGGPICGQANPRDGGPDGDASSDSSAATEAGGD